MQLKEALATTPILAYRDLDTPMTSLCTELSSEASPAPGEGGGGCTGSQAGEVRRATRVACSRLDGPMGRATTSGAMGCQLRWDVGGKGANHSANQERGECRRLTSRVQRAHAQHPRGTI